MMWLYLALAFLVAFLWLTIELNIEHKAHLNSLSPEERKRFLEEQEDEMRIW